MNTISGIYNLDRSLVTPGHLNRLSQLSGADQFGIIHKITDGIAVIATSGHGGWTSLAAAGRQDSENSCWAACNGRLDNRDELALLLGLARSDAELLSNAEILLAAYRKWGTDCLRYLNGDYAFAIWDAEAKHLFAASDHVRRRSFFYTFDGRRFAWATDLRLLLTDPMISEEYDLTYLTSFMVLDELNWERTPYKAIKLIPGGSALLVSQSGLKTWNWWELPEPQSLRYKDPRDYREHLRAVLRESVRTRMRTCGPTIVALSRGIDSSAVAATAMNILRDGDALCPAVHAVTIRPKGIPVANESNSAAKIARHIGIDHSIVTAQPFSGDLRPRMASAAFPSENVKLQSYWAVLREKCQELGATVILTGAAGELFGTSSQYITRLFKQRRYLPFLGEMMRWRRAGFPARQLMKDTIQALRDPAGDEGLLTAPDEILRRRPWVKHPECCHSAFDWPRERPSNWYLHAFFREIATCAEDSLMGFMASADIEIREPFMDRKVMEFAYSLPIEQKTPRDRQKPLLHESFEREIPRGLTHQSAYLNSYIDSDLHSVWRTMTAMLDRPSPAVRQIVDVEILKRNAVRMRMDSRDYAPLMSTYALLCWLETREGSK